MIEIYFTKNKDVYRKAEILIARKLNRAFTILRTKNGKPYIEGDPLYFSITHSNGRALIAICDKPVGVDMELYDTNGRLKNYKHVLSRFTEREKKQIDENFECFFLNWVCKEAYIKMNGGTLARDLKRLEYAYDKLYVDGREADCGYAVVTGYRTGAYAVCAKGYSDCELCECPFKLFRIRKGEKL